MNSCEWVTLSQIYKRDEWFLTGSQSEYFCRYVNEILTSQRFQDETVTNLLWYIWHGYDVGWHSRCRSVRSVLLESTIDLLAQNDFEKAKKVFSYLIAMYHNVEYINDHNWLDFKIEHFTYVWLNELFNIVLVWMLLDIEELPDIRNFSSDNVYNLVNY